MGLQEANRELLHEVLNWLAMVDLSGVKEIKFELDDCVGSRITVEFQTPEQS